MITKLTKREKEILPYLVLSKQKIADIFNISETTVITHIQAISSKLHTHSKQEALIMALKLGIITLDSVKIGA